MAEIIHSREAFLAENVMPHITDNATVLHLGGWPKEAEEAQIIRRAADLQRKRVHLFPVTLRYMHEGTDITKIQLPPHSFGAAIAFGMYTGLLVPWTLNKIIEATDGPIAISTFFDIDNTALNMSLALLRIKAFLQHRPLTVRRFGAQTPQGDKRFTVITRKRPSGQ